MIGSPADQLFGGTATIRRGDLARYAHDLLRTLRLGQLRARINAAARPVVPAWQRTRFALLAPVRYAGDAERLGYWIRQIQTRLYGLAPDGLPGNHDAGTLSAWYVFSAIGFYPIAGTDRYILGAPLVPGAVIPLGDDPTLTIEAPGAGVDRCHVAEVTLNGQRVEQNEVQHRDLLDGVLRSTFVEP
jgi:hypothetical protein